jgi:hypothetical protein
MKNATDHMISHCIFCQLFRLFGNS